MNPYKIVEEFENKIAKFTGALYAISCSSCTDALFMALEYSAESGSWFRERITIPTKTYVSVPMSIMKAGHRVVFDTSASTNAWQGNYLLRGTDIPIYDSAKELSRDMYMSNTLMCLSHHDKKPVSCGKGGSILTDCPVAAEWFKKYRYEGRSGVPYNEENVSSYGENMYLHPVNAALGLMNFNNYDKNSGAQPKEDYPPLHLMDFFKDFETIK